MFTLLKIVAKIVLLDIHVTTMLLTVHVQKDFTATQEILPVLYVVLMKYVQQQR